MKKKTINKLFKNLVGADPEFTVTFRGEKVNADTIESILFKSTHKKIPEGETGCDGCSSTGEIRPNASKSLEELVGNIKACLQVIAKELPVGFDMTTISMYAPIGGHIHLNLPRRYSNLTKYSKMLPALCFPIFIGENNISNAMRIAGGYGSMSDHRGQGSWADEKGIEYDRFEMRGLSAEWLISEKICRSTLAYVEMINEELIENPEIYELAKDLMVKTSQDENMLSSLYLNRNKLFVPAIMNKITKLVKKFKRYKDFKEEVDFILDYKKVLTEKKKHEFSIIKGWGFTQPKGIKNEHVKQLNGLISISYNTDINMEKFAQSLGEAVLVNNWNKNQYMIFGVKEIEQFLPFIYTKNKATFIEVKGYENFVVNKENFEIAKAKALRMGERFCSGCETEKNYIWNKERTKMKVEEKQKIIIGIPRTIREKLRFDSLIKFIKAIEDKNFKEIKQEDLKPVVKKEEKSTSKDTEKPVEKTKEEKICAE